MLDARESWTPTQDEFDAFAAVSGDDNAIHVDPAFCARTTFGRTVSHGMLIYTKLWGLLLRHRPDARQVSQAMMFPNPAYAGEEILLGITEGPANRLQMRAVRVADGAQVLTGTAEVA